MIVFFGMTLIVTGFRKRGFFSFSMEMKICEMFGTEKEFLLEIQDLFSFAKSLFQRVTGNEVYVVDDT